MSNTLKQLNLRAVIGLKGNIPNSVLIHGDRQHLIYSLGCAVIIEDMDTGKQDILQGHTNEVTCLAVSPCGKYVASGQETHMGFMADIFLWDYEKRARITNFALHKVMVKSISFSINSKYIVSLGGQDDGCVVVWSIQNQVPVCGNSAQPKSAGVTNLVICSQTNDDLFITAGDNSVRTWRIDLENRKVKPIECKLGSTKRSILCAAITSDDEYFFCGTSSGDILCVRTESGYLTSRFPEKNRFSLGVTSLCIIQDKAVIVGSGDGNIQEFRLSYKNLKEPKLSRENRKQKSLYGMITSITPRGLGHQFFVTTDKCHVYRFNFNDYSAELMNTCHYSAVNDVRFPHNTSDLVVTGGFETVRIFHVPSKKELLRVNIKNMTCYSVDVLMNGSAVISGWDDSRIRAFYPESGRLMYTINDAHKKGVTALASTTSGHRIISGGGEGQVRVWEISEVKQHAYMPVSYSNRSGGKIKEEDSSFVTKLIATMKEHANAVSCIKLSSDNTSCVSSSADGTCIVWCLDKFRRKQIIFSNTLFRAVCYHPEECQMITSGTDRKIGYWELYDGSLIRELDGSRSGSVNGMDISSTGDFFVTGGDDQLIKLWKYHEGEVIATGIGHSSAIIRVKISPNQKFIVSVCEDGGIFIWDMPESNAAAPQPEEPSTIQNETA